MDRDEVILEVLSHAKRMISNYAFAYGLDREDITQELACSLLESWPKAVCKAFSDNALKAYLYGAIRNQLLKMVPREERPLRLEDVGPILTINMYCDRDQMDIVMQAVHKALSKCSAKVQAYAIKAYGIADYEPDVPLPEPKRGSVRTKDIRKVFSQDQTIADLVGITKQASNPSLHEECRKLLRKDHTLRPCELVQMTGCVMSTASRVKAEFRRKA